MDVSVVMVNWNTRDALLRALASLQNHPPLCLVETIVVDNASDDGSAEAVARVYPQVRLVANRRMVGLAGANNQGLLASRGDAVVISNADVEFPRGTVDELAAALERHPRAGAVVPRLVHPDGTLQTSAGNLPTLGQAILGRGWSRRTARPGAASGFAWDAWDHGEERQVGRAGDACYVVRRATVVEVGLLDQGFPLDWEAIEWSARAGHAGWEIWFTPAAEVIHHAGGSTSRAGAARWVIATHRGMYRYFRSRTPALARVPLWAIFAARAATKTALLYARMPMRERRRLASNERLR